MVTSEEGPVLHRLHGGDCWGWSVRSSQSKPIEKREAGHLAKEPPDPRRLVLGPMLEWGWGVTAEEEGGWEKEAPERLGWRVAWTYFSSRAAPPLSALPSSPMSPTFPLSHPRIRSSLPSSPFSLSPGTWRPRRTVVFASWGAEEFGLIGSTEFTEVSELRRVGYWGDSWGGAVRG